MTGPLDLSKPPAAVDAASDTVRQRSGSSDVLPQSVADALLQLDGVVGVWMERDPGGQPVVILHTSRQSDLQHLPDTVEGMPVRRVGGEPIRAQR